MRMIDCRKTTTLIERFTSFKYILKSAFPMSGSNYDKTSFLWPTICRFAQARLDTSLETRLIVNVSPMPTSERATVQCNLTVKNVDILSWSELKFPTKVSSRTFIAKYGRPACEACSLRLCTLPRQRFQQLEVQPSKNVKIIFS